MTTDKDLNTEKHRNPFTVETQRTQRKKWVKRYKGLGHMEEGRKEKGKKDESSRAKSRDLR